MNGEIEEPHPTLAYHLPKEVAECVAREAADWDLQLDSVKLMAPWRYTQEAIQHPHKNACRVAVESLLGHMSCLQQFQRN